MEASQVIAILIAYFLGNISPSTLLARARGLNIKKEGSGNAGTTNTLRVLGPKAALITLCVDIGKGVIAVVIGRSIGGMDLGMYCALAVFFGHIWPVLLKFQGGKGVATAFGALCGLNFPLALASLAVVIAGVLITRRVSFGSIIVCLCFPLLCWYMEPDFFVYGLIMAAVILFKHRSNMVRLAHGEEKPIDFGRIFTKKKRGSAPDGQPEPDRSAGRPEKEDSGSERTQEGDR